MNLASNYDHQQDFVIYAMPFDLRQRIDKIETRLACMPGSTIQYNTIFGALEKTFVFQMSPSTILVNNWGA